MNPKEVKLIRLLVGVIVMIVMLFMLFIFMAIPSVNYYKKENSRYLEVKAKYDATKNSHQDSLNRLLDLKSDNRRVIESFANSFDEEVFVRYLHSKFDDVEIVKSEEITEEKFLRYKITVSTSMQTPMRFYEFLNDINHYSNILEVEFPISFEMIEGTLFGSFDLKKYHYKIKTK